MGGVEGSGVNHRPSLETESIWKTILDTSDFNLFKILEDPAADLSSPQGVQLFGDHSLIAGEEKKQKKRKADKKYRQRQREDDKRRKLEKKELAEKKAQLKREYDSYQRDIDSIKKDMKKKREERENLKASIDKLTQEVRNEKKLVTTLCRMPSVQKDMLERSDQLDIALLKNGHAILGQNCNWEYENKGSKEEIAKLASDIKALLVQRQALLERILKTRTLEKSRVMDES